jgi:hypothetical protein
MLLEEEMALQSGPLYTNDFHMRLPGQCFQRKHILNLSWVDHWAAVNLQGIYVLGSEETERFIEWGDGAENYAWEPACNGHLRLAVLFIPSLSHRRNEVSVMFDATRG